MTLALLYHDVVPRGMSEASGFAGAGAMRYKLDTTAFQSHLDAIATVVDGAPSLGNTGGWQLTFDDGGASAFSPIAEMLEARGWRGAFFVTTDRIDTTGFLSRPQIRELHARGHLIGTHSCSHPARMARCSMAELRREWADSREVLSGIVGTPVDVGSVPGGFFSRSVAVAAAEAGLRTLYTSEPATRATMVAGCAVLGRLAVFRDTSASQAAALARGDRTAVLNQWVVWNLKKAAKAVGGERYLQMREWLLRRRRGS